MPYQGQVFGVATYDALFKHVLSGDDLRPSFFHAFIPGLEITSSKRLDDHMNPLKELQRLRTFLGSPKSKKAVKELSGAQSFDVRIYEKGQEQLISNPELTNFLKDILGYYDDIKFAIPEERYDGTMDFVCQLNTNDYALVEMQITPQNYGDLRALAYVAAFYGNQLFRGEKFIDLKRVIGLNLLGGGREQTHHWTDTPDQYVRHYQFEEQIHGERRKIHGFELIQYAIMHAPKDNSNREQKDWLTFFKSAHEMTEEDVKAQIITPSVLEAFSRAKYKHLPDMVRKGYDNQDASFSQYSQHTDDLVMEGKMEGKIEGRIEGKMEGKIEEKFEIAKRLLGLGLSDKMVCEGTGLSMEELALLKNINKTMGGK